MQAQARNAASGKSFGMAEEKKLADKIEKTRHTAMQLIQVIDFLAQRRVELVGVKDLDSSYPFKPLNPNNEDDMASICASAKPSISSLACSSIASLALPTAAAQKPSTATRFGIQSLTNDSTTPRRTSRFIPRLWR
jgi:hypothetical protein